MFFPAQNGSFPINLHANIVSEILTHQSLINTQESDMSIDDGGHWFIGRDTLLPFVEESKLGHGGYTLVDKVKTRTSQKVYA